MLSCAVCKVETSNLCSKCRKTSYCGVECQKQDWPTHKKQCCKPQPGTSTSGTPPGPGVAIVNSNMPYPTSFSQFGQTYNMFTGVSQPLSHSAVFFEELFGFSREEPAKVYIDLVDAFRLRRIDDMSAGKAVGSATSDFIAFMEKAKKSGILPTWWRDEVHGPDVHKFAREDDWARLDQDVTAKDIIAHHNPDGKKKPEMRLRMMVERVLS